MLQYYYVASVASHSCTERTSVGTAKPVWPQPHIPVCHTRGTVACLIERNSIGQCRPGQTAQSRQAGISNLYLPLCLWCCMFDGTLYLTVIILPILFYPWIDHLYIFYHYTPAFLPKFSRRLRKCPPYLTNQAPVVSDHPHYFRSVLLRHNYIVSH